MRIATALFALLTSTPAAIDSVYAEQSEDIGDFVIHYEVMNTDFMDPRVARLYGIKAAKSMAMLNVTVLKKHMGLTSLPTQAKINAATVASDNQTRPLAMREIMDGGAIYYIGQFPVAGPDPMRFQLEVTPYGGPEHTLSFQKSIPSR